MRAERGHPQGMVTSHHAGDEERGDEAAERATPTPEEVGPGPEVERRAPDAPTDLKGRSWLGVLKGSVREFKDDELTDRAAALTYYGILASSRPSWCSSRCSASAGSRPPTG